MGNSYSDRSIHLKIIIEEIGKAGIKPMIWRLKCINKSIKFSKATVPLIK